MEGNDTAQSLVLVCIICAHAFFAILHTLSTTSTNLQRTSVPPSVPQKSAAHTVYLRYRVGMKGSGLSIGLPPRLSSTSLDLFQEVENLVHYFLFV